MILTKFDVFDNYSSMSYALELSMGLGEEGSENKRCFDEWRPLGPSSFLAAAASFSSESSESKSMNSSD